MHYDRLGGAMSPATPKIRELAFRQNDGVSVRLLWHPRENADPFHRWLREHLLAHAKRTRAEPARSRP